jgi:hypothetical protein
MAEAFQLRSALVEDARDAIYSGVLTIGEAAQGLDRRLFTWATVKLYYSVFYLTRAMLGVNGIALFYVNGKPYVWTAKAGALPVKSSGTTHAAVLKAFEEFMPAARVKVVVACFMQPVAVFLMLANAFERSSRAQG